MIPDYSIEGKNVAVFELRDDGVSYEVRFLRGTDGGWVLKSIPTITEYYEHLDGDLDPDDSEDLFRLASETLAEELENPEHQSLMAEAGKHDNEYRPEVTILLVNQDAARLISAMTDFQIQSLHDASLELWDKKIMVSDEEDQICTTRHGSATEMAIYIGPKRQAKIVSIERLWIGDDDATDDPYAIEGESGETAFTLGAYHIGQEWTGKVSKKNAASSFSERLTALRKIQEADHTWSPESQKQQAEITGAIHDEICGWVFNELSPTLPEPLAQKHAGEVYQEATQAPIELDDLSEARIESLLRHVAVFDDSLGAEHPREGMDTAQKHRLGCFGYGSGFGRCYADGVIVFELSSQTNDLPAAISHAMPLSVPARRILLEIVAAASPRGGAIRGYSSNRANSVIPGPARRLFKFDSVKDYSAHDALLAVDGITSFLKERGRTDDDISRILAD